MSEAASPEYSGDKKNSVPESTVEKASQELLIEISKTLLSSSLAATRGAMQILQGVTGILLASYTTFLVGFGKEVGINKIPVIIAVLPIVLYILSLISAFGQVALYHGARLVIGDLHNAFEAYEAVIAAQRKQLILPLFLSLAGIVSVIIVIEYLLNLL